MPFNVPDLKRQHTKQLTALAGVLDKAATKIGGRAQFTAQSTTTITNRTGAGRSGWKYRCWRTRDGAGVDLTNTVKHMKFQEDGTGVFGPKRAPYLIRAKRSKYLRFVTAGGQLVFRKSVRHFGVHPRLIGKAAMFGRQAPFYGEDHNFNIATFERECSRVTR